MYTTEHKPSGQTDSTRASESVGEPKVPPSPLRQATISETPAGVRSQRATTNAEALRSAERIVAQVRPLLAEGAKDTTAILHTILDAVFDDREIRLNFVGAEIRYTAMCGEVAREVLRTVGESPDLIGLLTVGDVNLPEFARTTIEAIMEASHSFHRQLSLEETHGYDLSSRGSLRARQALMAYFDRYYGFGTVPDLLERLAENAAITAGGMRGLDDLATAHVRLAESSRRRARFIHPDNSFGTWHAITELRSVGGRVATVHALPTRPDDALHLTREDVAGFYDQATVDEGLDGRLSTATKDLWCITPVGNPSGTRMEPQQLTHLCAEIVARAPEATILLDSTYVRTLPDKQGCKLMRGVIETPELLDRVIFLDSFSKTHGVCGERIGVYFSASRELFDAHHSINMMLSAGNGRQKSALALAIAQATPEQEQSIRSLHRFWQQERLGLYHYLLGRRQFADLFDDDQRHLRADQLESPLGLYLLVKLREGVSGKDVLMRTGCLGVETPMGSGRYMRFAVGKITSPTYSRYIPTS